MRSTPTFMSSLTHILAPAIAIISLAAPLHAQQVTKTVEMWAMRDGTRLSTTVYRPLLGGKYPVILHRTPYVKDQPSDDAWAAAWVAQGYVFINQNLRGRFDSEGEDSIFRDDGWGERQDGYDTIEYAASRPWSNGKVGMYGASASGITSEFAAVSAPPSLKCQVILVGANDAYGQFIYQGGTLRNEMVETWLTNQGQHADEMPRFEAHPTDDSFWDQYDALENVSRVRAPALFIGGWYDIFSQATIDGFLARQGANVPGVAGENFLWMGPWTHGSMFSQNQGQLTYPVNAADGTAGWTLIFAFYNHHLKGGPRPQWPAVTYYTMGPTDWQNPTWNSYRSASTWPPAASTREMYLHPTGKMMLSPSLGFQHFDFISDPANPVPTAGGLNLVIPAGPYDQRPIEAREDVIEFETSPLMTPMEVSGRVTARLWIQSDCPDVDLAVRLSDVYPDGRSMLVLDGIQRVRFREGYETEKLMTPGELVEVEVDLWSTSIVFAPGHKMRVSISGSNFSRFDTNPNTGEPFRQNTHQRTALIRLWTTPWTPSAIILPSIPQLLNRR